MEDLNVRLHRQLWVFSSRLTRLDGEPQVRAGEKNGARKSLVHLPASLSALTAIPYPKQVNLLASYGKSRFEFLENFSDLVFPEKMTTL